MEAPRRIGGYELVGKMTRSGIAEMFLARAIGPEGFQKLVMIKRLLPRYTTNPRLVKQFIDEAKLAATLDHPHIACVHELGLAGDSCFFTMEHVLGQSVSAVLQRTNRLQRPLPIEHAILVARCAANALHHAHERRDRDGALVGIVHGEISPHTVIVTYDGVVKLVDFGAARIPTRNVDTRTGTVKGRSTYASPEQMIGAAIDRRTDIYALGGVLWEMLTGERYTREGNDLSSLQAMTDERPRPPSELRREVPPDLDRIVSRALAVDPALRYQTAEELELELEAHAREFRLRQTPSALRAQIQQLFAAELISWNVFYAQLAAPSAETSTVTRSLRPAGEEHGSDQGDEEDTLTSSEGDADDSSEYTQVDEAYGVIEPLPKPEAPFAEPEQTTELPPPAVFAPPPPVRQQPPPRSPPTPHPPSTTSSPPGTPLPHPHAMFGALHPSDPRFGLYGAPPEWTAMAHPRRPLLSRPLFIIAMFLVMFGLGVLIALLA